jgi:hypothetical protein
MRFPYRYQNNAGPQSAGVHVIYSPHLETAPGTTTMLYAPSNEWRRQGVILTSDPDFEWTFYRLECIDQARRIVRDGLLARLPWLRLVDA